MSGEMWTRVILSLILAGNLIWYIYSCQNREKVVHSETDDRRRYLRYGFGNVLPWVIGVLVILEIGMVGIRQAMTELFPMLCNTFLHICIYYALLLLCVPLLRRKVSARVCAALWMLPNVLYLTYSAGMSLAKPLLIIPLPGHFWKYGLIVWGIGFSGVMLTKIISHLQFRQKILRGAEEITDAEILAIWEKAQKEAGYTKENGYKKLPYRLMVSSAVRTPLSVGMFQRTIRVVLPKREYESEELQLIFRHELVHVGREDASNKFFLTFCTAMCWFNPLLWMAGRYCAEDLELSCDETVLLGENQEKRERYAELLLRTAGDDRGFTTCLSTSARALHYRLQHVLKPTRKKTGAILIGTIAFALLITHGYVTFAGTEYTGKEVVFQNRDLSEYTIESVRYYEAGESNPYEGIDETAIKEGLEKLELRKIYGKYSFSGQEEYHYIRMYDGETTVELTFFGDIVQINRRFDKRYLTTQYICSG